MKKTGISLCMIVKNEAHRLPAFIRATEGLWDELCVVDTGSTDATPQIFENEGATIQHQKWRDDFAQARNHSLKMASHEWILVLDPDELPSQLLASEIRQLAQIQDAGAATMVMRNYWPNGNYRDKRLMRMFRNRDHIQYRIPIHEEAVTSVSQMLCQENKDLVHLQGIVTHLGYERTEAVSREKKDRDLRILKKVLSDNPNDLYSWYRYLDVARYWNDAILLRSAAQNALHALQKISFHRDTPYLGDFLVLIATSLFPKQPKDQLFFLRGWQHRITDHPALFAQTGLLYETLGKNEEAKKAYTHCLSLKGISGDFNLMTITPTLGLARLLILEGQLNQAFSYVEEALALNALNLEAICTGLCIVYIVDGECGIEDFTNGYIKIYGDSHELHHALGEHYFSYQKFTKALTHFKKAAGNPPSGRSALKLSQTLFALSRFTESKVALNVIQKHYPEAQLAYWLMEQCEHVHGTTNQENINDHISKLLAPWVSLLPKTAENKPASVIHNLEEHLGRE
jgi:glycosyltransferase involved in cell wall biosynthesis